MDPPSNNDDTTTTEYDSGGSEGVDYAYEGKQVAALRRGSNESSASQRRIRKDTCNRSPRRKTSPPRATKARTTPPTTTTTRCVCGGAGGRARESDDSDATVSTDRTSSESDTEDEDGPGKRLSRPRRRRASGLRGGGDSDVEEDRRHCDGRCCDRRKKTRKNSTTTNASKKSAAKKTPYIEEYPEEIRPVVLLKEHKLPRGSFSNSTTTDSNAKRLVRGTEDHAQMSSSLGKIQSMGKRPPWNSFSSATVREEGQQHEQQHSSSHSSEKQQQQQQQQHRRRRRQQSGGHGTKLRHEGERLSSSSDFFDSDSASDSSPARDRDIVRDRDRRPSIIRRNSRQQAERGGEMMPPSAVARSSAARNHSSSPKYSSSWPLQQRGGDASSSYDRDYSRRHQHHRIITQEPEQIDPLGGYESSDESDDIFTGEFEFDEMTHRRLPRRPPSPPPAHHHRQHRAEQVLHRQPSAQLQSLREQREEEEPRRRPGQGRSVKPPRPPVARTVVTNRPSMGALDQGIDIDRAGTYAAEPCDIWRGRPEDWESPYSESSDHEDEDDYDYQYRSSGEGGGGGGAYGSRRGGIGYDAMMLLEGGRRQRPHARYERCSSPQLLPPRRSGDLKSVFSLGFSRHHHAGRDLSPAPTTFSAGRRSRAWDAADEHGGGMLLEPPAPSVRGGGGRRARAPSRAPTERSRWTVMAPSFEDRYHHHHQQPYEEYDYGYGYGENDYGVPYSPPPPPAPEEETFFNADGYYSYGGAGYGPSIRVQAPSPPAGGSGLTAPPPLRRGGGYHRGMPTAMTEEEEMEYGYGYGRASGGLLSPVPTRTAAARFNFDKSWSELSRLLL
ncbi:hypothetical protein V8F33_012999 [Rhypophila sp. PSN 637]